MSTSNAHSLCRLTNNRAVKTAETCIKGEQLRPHSDSLACRYKRTKQDSQHRRHEERNSLSCHIKKKQPGLLPQESIAGPVTSREHCRPGTEEYLPFVLQKETFVCDTKGSDIVGDAQKRVSVVRHQYHRHPQAAHRVPATQPGTSLLHT